MKSLAIRQNGNGFRFDLKTIRSAVHDALTAVENARQKCLLAGAMLNDVQASLPHGKFECWVKNNLPEITDRTARFWARAAANVVKVLPPIPHDDSIEVEATVSAILSTPEAELSDPAREWRQQWLDFTADKTIKECLDGVFVDGDPAHRVDRAVNGRVKGGSGNAMAPLRKEFPMFVATKLKETGGHLSHWETMSELQRTDIKSALRAAVLGESLTVQMVCRGGTKRSVTYHYSIWPEELCRAALEVLRQRLRGEKQG